MDSGSEAQRLLSASPTPKSPSPPTSSPHIPPSQAIDPLDSGPICTFKFSIALNLRFVLIGFILPVIILTTDDYYYRSPALFFVVIYYFSLFWNVFILLFAYFQYVSSHRNPSRWEGWPSVVIKVGSLGFTCGASRGARLPLRLPGEDVLERGAMMLGGGKKAKKWLNGWVMCTFLDLVFGILATIGAADADDLWYNDRAVRVLLGFVAAFYFLIPILSCLWFFRSLNVKIYRDEDEDFQYEYSIRIPESRKVPVSMTGGVAA